jgi:hypothetical protein
MVDIITVPPGVWTEVGSLQVRHNGTEAVEVLVYPAGHVELGDRWHVRTGTPRARRPVEEPEPRVVEHRTMSGAARLFTQPSAAAQSAVRSDRTLGSLFVCRHTSMCGHCGDELEEGGTGRFYDGEAMHKACAERAAEDDSWTAEPPGDQSELY